MKKICRLMISIIQSIFFLSLSMVAHSQCEPKNLTPPDKNIKTKEIKIYNNSDSITLYPMIETSTNDTDEWLQAASKVCRSELNARKYTHDDVYRIYLPSIEPGGHLRLRVPFYSKLTASAGLGETPNEYINWWNGGRVKLYDVEVRPNEFQEIEETQQNLPAGVVGLCLMNGNACQPLEIWRSKAALYEDTPHQLLEYTFSDAIKDSDPYRMDYRNVDYDISYVDHLYLPVAMGAINNPYIGYTGTIMPVDQFRNTIIGFRSEGQIGDSWPLFILRPETTETKPKIPGAYKAIAEHSKSETYPNGALTEKGKSIDDMYRLWALCVPGKGFESLILKGEKSPHGRNVLLKKMMRPRTPYNAFMIIFITTINNIYKMQIVRIKLNLRPDSC